MGKGRTVTLRDIAAAAFVLAKTGKRARTEREKLLRIATFVHMHMAEGDVAGASFILRVLVRDGLEVVSNALSGTSPAVDELEGEPTSPPSSRRCYVVLHNEEPSAVEDTRKKIAMLGAALKKDERGFYVEDAFGDIAHVLFQIGRHRYVKGIVE